MVEKIFSNLDATIFLCMVNHKRITDRMLPHESIAETLPIGASIKQQQRASAKQQAFQFMAQLAKRKCFEENLGKFSVSHSRDYTVLLASYSPDVLSCGVDIETFDTSRRIRPFLREYLTRCSCTFECKFSPLLLSIILFCCMESLYKMLSAFQLMTFSIDDYHLKNFSENWCEFTFVGSQAEIKGNVFRCRYFQFDGTIVAKTLIDSQFISI